MSVSLCLCLFLSLSLSLSLSVSVSQPVSVCLSLALSVTLSVGCENASVFLHLSGSLCVSLACLSLLLHQSVYGQHVSVCISQTVCLLPASLCYCISLSMVRMYLSASL